MSIESEITEYAKKLYASGSLLGDDTLIQIADNLNLIVSRQGLTTEHTVTIETCHCPSCSFKEYS